MHADGPQGPVGDGVRRAMEAIAAYLARYPDAADSEAGIFEWWLVEMKAEEVSLDELRAALHALVAAGQLRVVQLADGTAIYGAAPGRAAGS